MNNEFRSREKNHTVGAVVVVAIIVVVVEIILLSHKRINQKGCFCHWSYQFMIYSVRFLLAYLQSESNKP